MSFTVVTSHRLEDLFDALCERLAAAPLPPLVAEPIVVPGQGIARWLELRLADRFGIAAGVQLPFLGPFLHGLGGARERATDPFHPDVLPWRLWRLLGGGGASADAFGPAAAYCDDDPDGRKRLQLCRRVADCFDAYQLYRPDLLQAFARGEDHKALSPHAPWQARLWRALLADDGIAPLQRRTPRRSRAPDPTPPLFPGFDEHGGGDDAREDATLRAHLLPRVHRAIDDPGWRARALPPRLSLFGATTVPPALLELLRHLGEHLPVYLYAPRPTAHYVGDQRRRRVAPGDHGLLARCGAESREFTDLLLDLETRDDGREPLQHVELAEPAAPDDAPPDLLACVQRDIVAAHDRGARGAARFRVRDDDLSLCVHDCHSPQRELEVVRDQILAALRDDPTLAPHDVLVLVPDIDRYAPYAHAVFGPVREHLPFLVADRSPAAELPLCRAVLQTLGLSRDRLQRTDVLHLLEVLAVQQRFGLSAQDLPVLRHLCDAAGIRWGLDGDDRAARHGLPADDDNTWRQGLERLLLGTLTGPCDELVLGRLPVGDTTDARSDLVARFAACVHTLFAALPALVSPQPLAAWADRVDELVARLFAPTGAPDDDDALQALQRATAALRAHARAARHTDAVSPQVFRDWLAAALAAGAGARGFLGGGVTIAAMLPMRAVPVRCLFLCGLDDASFPRRDRPLPFDLIAAGPRPGDRSRRLDDRQLFLELLLAARDRLHLTFVGRSIKDNAECAPSVLLAELLDHIDRTCITADGRPARDLVTVRHPLQPWSPRYAGRHGRMFTFARMPMPPAGERLPEPPWCPADLRVPADATADGGEPLPLALLFEFWSHPCRTFLRRTLQIRVRAPDEVEHDDEPFALGHLDRYRLQDERVRRFLRGEPPPPDPFALARAAAVLPVGEQGRAAFCEVEADTRQFLAAAAAQPALGPRRIDVRVGGDRLVGEIDHVGDDDVVHLRIAKLKPKDQLRAWLAHLLVTVQRHQDGGDAPWPRTTLLLARDGTWRYHEVPADDAERMLAAFVAHLHAGLARPLPFFHQSSCALGRALHRGHSPEQALRAARGEWDGDATPERPPGDRDDPDIQLCMRGRDPFAGGADGEFFRLAQELWLAPCSYLHEHEV